MSALLEPARKIVVDVGEARISASVMGTGPPVLLLHGYPQSRAMWHSVAPSLARTFTVVAPDLRGYGESSAPDGGPNHEGYSKRVMAADQVAVMKKLGFERFMVAGHDRGGRVAHRMALDHPRTVTKLAVLDIVPTRVVFATANRALSTAYFHWFFLIQPNGLPEQMIGADPEWWLRELLDRWSGDGAEFHPGAVAEYVSYFSREQTIHASCEDYRAASGIDLEHDAGDTAVIEQPLLVLWGREGAMHRLYDVIGTWTDLARDATGRALDCGHFLPEERPAEVAAALHEFFG